MATLEAKLGAAARYPRLTAAAQEAILAAEGEWAESSQIDVAEGVGGGLALTLGWGIRSKTVVLPARLEFRWDRDAELRRIVAEVKAELVPGA